MGTKKIIVYSGAGCSACTQVKEFLERKGLSFEVRDITEDETAQMELMDIGAMSIPVTVIDDGEPIIGANFAKLEAALGA